MGIKRLPKFVPMTLTTLQLSQMMIGCYISSSVYRLKKSGLDCHQSFENLYFCFLIYFTYGILFAKFFWNQYVSKHSDQVEGYGISTFPSAEMPVRSKSQKKMD